VARIKTFGDEKIRLGGADHSTQVDLFQHHFQLGMRRAKNRK
jgi:hypothetical protein